MSLCDDEREALFRIDSKLKFIEERGCNYCVEEVKILSKNLEKNTREHIWIKGWAYATTSISAIAALFAGIMWKKHGG